MATFLKTKSSELRGISQLSVDAVVGVTNIAESLHSSILRMGGLLGKPGKPTRGVTGLVYRNVRGITKLVGKGIDLPLRLLADDETFYSVGARGEALRSALNGVLGDHLAARENPLAIRMQMRHGVEPIDVPGLQKRVEDSGGRLFIFIHGLCMNDNHWQSDTFSFPASLEQGLKVSPVFLHYNTGRHISDNGRELATLINELMEEVPAIRELNIIAHSMGGLVIRSACHYAKEQNYSWPGKLKKAVFLGTPHHGAPMEKVGNLIDLALETNAYSSPFARLGKIRSSGITDLRHGYIVEDDWAGKDRFEYRRDRRYPVPLPAGVDCMAIAAVWHGKSKLAGSLGDGLVTVQSALGRHSDPALDIQIPEARRHVVSGIHHMDLMRHPDVYGLIRQHLAG